MIAIANQKGGVGKSTTAVSLAAALAERGVPVLVVDLDPQGNASTGLGIGHEERTVSVYQVLAGEIPVEDAVRETRVPNLFAVPATIDLAGAEIELVSLFSREARLAKALEPVMDGRFRFILLDCPPSLGLLTVNALVAARELLVPIQCEYYALEGLGQLLHNVGLVQQNVNPDLRLTGIVLTMYDSRTRLAEQVVEDVRRFFGDRVYDTVIPRTVRLSEAPGFGEPITVYDPRSRGAECYRALAGELLDRPVPESAETLAAQDIPRSSPAIREPRASGRDVVELPPEVEGPSDDDEPQQAHRPAPDPEASVEGSTSDSDEGADAVAGGSEGSEVGVEIETAAYPSEPDAPQSGTPPDESPDEVEGGGYAGDEGGPEPEPAAAAPAPAQGAVTPGEDPARGEDDEGAGRKRWRLFRKGEEA